jgi:hypothetical protein
VTAQHRGEASDQRGEQCAVGPVSCPPRSVQMSAPLMMQALWV